MKKYFSDIRNVLHSFIGLVIGYDLTLLFGFPNREEFPFDYRIALMPIVGAILVWGLSFFWEKRQDTITPNVSDMKDVWNGFVFAYLGGLLCLFAPSLIVAIIISAMGLVLFLKMFD